MERFEVIRRDYYVHGQSKRWIARYRHVHRRTVRQALGSALPPARKQLDRVPPVLTQALRTLVDDWLRGDRSAPRKQRHTARRIYRRLVTEHGYAGAESTVRRYVGGRRRELGLRVAAYVPQSHLPGEDAEVDWYEAAVAFADGRRVVQFFVMRASYSGREFHRAFARQTQQAFLEGHVAAFDYFGGVFSRIRYDHLGSAVRRILRGRRRAEAARFVALRSHYLFEAEFCRPGPEGAHEKGGVEGAVGRFRRTHLVPVPKVKDLDELNARLCRSCAEDDQRRLAERSRCVIEEWSEEQPRLRALSERPFQTAEVTTARVDNKSRVRVRTNHYSVPVSLVGQQVEVQVHAQRVVILHSGREVARHGRLHARYGERLVLDHYLDLLKAKPGALARARPLRQMREAGHWPAAYDQLWAERKRRYGEAEGARQLIDVLMLHRSTASEIVTGAVSRALKLGCCSASAIMLLVRGHETEAVAPPVLNDLGPLGRYGQGVPRSLAAYDALRPSVIGALA